MPTCAHLTPCENANEQYARSSLTRRQGLQLQECLLSVACCSLLGEMITEDLTDVR